MSSDPIKDALEELLREFDIKIDSTDGASQKESGDYSEMIGKTQDKLDELSVKAEEMLRDSGLSREELENYCSNRNNFTEEQWQALENLKKATSEFKEKTRLTLGDEILKKGEQQPGKKQSSRFGKKKHWIPL